MRAAAIAGGVAAVATLAAPRLVRRPGLAAGELQGLGAGLVAEGLDNTDIAERLFLSPSTVKNHVSSILEKLGVDSRVQAAVRAARAGIV